jgi:hypothetical protein
MEQIHYAGNTITTGSDIAHAVLEYAQALASNSDSATISIPVQHVDGTTVTAEVLIGPASQLIAEPYESDGPELEDADAVRRLNEAAAKLRTPRAMAEDPGDYPGVGADDLDQSAGGLEA